MTTSNVRAVDGREHDRPSHASDLEPLCLGEDLVRVAGESDAVEPRRKGGLERAAHQGAALERREVLTGKALGPTAGGNHRDGSHERARNRQARRLSFSPASASSAQTGSAGSTGSSRKPR